MNASYSHSLRVWACERCGAPLDVTLDEGLYPCTYCGARNRLARRDESGDRSRALAGAAAVISESERHARLRDQERQGESLPASVEALTFDGELDAQHVDEARADWRQARTALVAAPSCPLSERLFFLTVLLVPHVESRELRALLETAIELLPDEGHRHIMRCMMARFAARSGDATAAEQWLAPCNPRPLDLPMDTAYRYASATLATVQQQYDRVVVSLGLESGDVPLAERDELGCALLRIHALEKQGLRREAADSLAELRATVDSRVLDTALKDSVPGLCGGTLREVSKRDLEKRISALESELAVRTAPTSGARLRNRLTLMAVVTAVLSLPVSFAAAMFTYSAQEAFSEFVRWLTFTVPAALLLAVVVLLAAVRSGGRARARLSAELADARRKLAGLHQGPPARARS